MLANKLEVLDEQLQDETLEITQEEISSQYKIDNLDSLDWAFRKIANYRNEFAEQEAYAKEQIRKINDWLAKERAKNERNIGFFEHLVTEYHASILAENPKKKSISTPNGKVQSTTRKPSIVKPDADSLPQLIEYAEQNAFDQFVEVKKELKWVEFKKHLTLTDDLKVVDSNGQIVEGIPLSEGGTSFKITTD